jgi:hypothetical protein
MSFLLLNGRSAFWFEFKQISLYFLYGSSLKSTLTKQLPEFFNDVQSYNGIKYAEKLMILPNSPPDSVVHR